MDARDGRRSGKRAQRVHGNRDGVAAASDIKFAAVDDKGEINSVQAIADKDAGNKIGKKIFCLVKDYNLQLQADIKGNSDSK